MRFADPKACPDCRGVIDGHPVCPHCHLDLTSTEVRQLWQTLLQADDLLTRAGSKRQRPYAAQPAPTAPQTPTMPVPPQRPQQPGQPQAQQPVAPPPPAGPFAPHPAPGPRTAGAPPTPPVAQRPERQWSVGTILLVLGALGLIVSGFIFVTQSWGDLGLLARTLVLSGVTVVLAALGVWVTRRPLRASAEAVWTIVLALLTLDFFAARHEGLLGMDQVDLAWAWVVWGAVVLGLGAGIALWSRSHVKADLVAPALAGGVGIAVAGVGAANVPVEWEMSWRSILALVVVGLLSLATRPAGLRPLTITARVVTGAFFLWSFAAAAVELFDHPGIDEVVADGHGLPIALMAIVSLVVGWVVHQVRIPASALAVLAACALIVTPAADEWRPDGWIVAVAVIATLLAVAAHRGTNDWLRGTRLGAIPVVVALLGVHVWLISALAEVVGRTIESPWNLGWDDRFAPTVTEDVATWVVPVVGVALLVVTWFVARWPELGAAGSRAASLVVLAAGVAVADAVVAARLPVWLAVAVVLVAAAVFALPQLRALGELVGLVAAALVLTASALAVAHQGVSALTWIAGAAVLAALVVFDDPLTLRRAYAAGATTLLVAGVWTAADLLDVPEAVPPLVAVVAALALVAAAGTVLRRHPVRLSVEIAAGVAGLVPLLAEGSSGELSVRWTIAGVALVALSFVVADRRSYLWPGGFALLVAYVLLIVDSGFSFVEAYTLPLGAIALAVGLYLTRKRLGTSTWLLLGPGLAIALLPSVPQALADPTGLRALLLGIGAVAALGLGVRLGWQAPFVSGVVIVALLVLFNIGPYANAAPRVVLIAAVGAILLGFGITWEDRVRDGRRLVGYVRAMR